MDAAGEVVESSDPEESEEIAASKPDYWPSIARDFARRRESLKRRPLEVRKSEGPPHKRRKLDSPPAHTPSPPQPRANLPSPYSSPGQHPTTLLFHDTASAPTSSPTSYVFPSPTQQPQELAKEGTPAFLDDGIWLSEKQDFVQGSSNQSSRREAAREASTSSPSPSPDPLLLFTPPRRTNASPGRDCVAVSSPTSSPLTPISSPAKHSDPRHAPPSSPLPPPSTAREQTPPPPSAADIAAIQRAEAADRARYSLRTRNARQLNPYEYDKRLYKHQMRANPDAIVKLLSPSRARRGQRSTSPTRRDGSSGAEDEYQAADDEDMDDEDSLARRRRKGKDREGGGQVGENGAPELLEKWFPDAFLQSSSSSEDDADLLLGCYADHEKGRKEKKADKEHRRKRPRPFPMTKKDLRRSVSPRKSPERSPSPFHKAPPHPKERPKPRPRLREPTVQPQPEKPDVIVDDDDEPLVPAPTWRRRRSRMFSSPKSSPQSRKSKSLSPQRPPPADDDDDLFAQWPGNGADDFNAYNDHDDMFFRAQSPFALAGTSGTEPDEPTSQHAPPPTSDEPTDVIDITSDDDDPVTDSDSESEADERDRRNWKILNRLMPAVMVKQMTASEQARRAAAAARERERERDAESAEREEPLLPGQSRRRIGSRRSAEIRGDSESEDDVDMRSRSPSARHMHMLGADGAHRASEWSDGDRDRGQPLSDASIGVIEPIGHQPRPKYRPESGHISVSDDELSTDTEDEDVEGAVGGRGSGALAKGKGQDNGEAEEADAIDRMLTRSFGNSRRRKKRSGTRRGEGRRVGGGGGGRRRKNGDIRDYGVLHGEGGGGRRRTGGGGDGSRPAGGGGGSGGGKTAQRAHGLRITTVGAKRYGAGQQTLLTFPRLPTLEPGEPIEFDDTPPPYSPQNEVQFTGDEPVDAKAKKKAKQKAKQAGVYVFKSGATHMISGRSNVAHVTIDEEIPAIRAPSFRDAERSRPARSNSKAKLQRQSSKRTHLEEYWNPGDDQYEHDGFVVSDGSAPGPSSQHKQAWKGLQHVTVDFGIEQLLPGISFPSATYLGRGWLHDLITLPSRIHDIPTPLSCSMFDCYLHADMTILELMTCLEVLYNHLRDLVLGSAGPADYGLCQNWQNFLHSVSQHLSYLLFKADDDAHATLATNAEALVRRLGGLMEEPTEIIPDDEIPNPLILQVLWFLVEASCRLSCDRRRKSEEPDRALVVGTVTALTRKLWDFTFGHAAVSLELTQECLANAQIPQQVAELWVCLLNLANDQTFQASSVPKGFSFWTCYLQVLQGNGLQMPQTNVVEREAIWRSIFSLCALSQFSVHGSSLAFSLTEPRLTPSWQVVAAVLERAPLALDAEADASLTKRVLRMRDEYVSVLVTRCLLLNLKWHWRLDSDDAPAVFNRLLDVFKSRHFANLAIDWEESDFPSFLRKHDLSRLQEKQHSDSAFILFLKLVVRAADEMRKDNPQVMVPPKLKKILSLAVPVGSVPFTKATPPSSHALSMLFNRFSAVAVAIYLEPTVPTVRYRLSNARRYVNFKDTNNETRVACIRGAMYLAILLRHLNLPLTDILEWLGDMTNVLIDEHQAADAVKGAAASQGQEKEGVGFTICMLLRSVCHVLRTSTMGPDKNEHKYPDPRFLQGPWVTRVFSTATNLSTNVATRNEIRTFVQAFLDARKSVIPPPPRPPPRRGAVDSQDSQDDLYGPFDIDLDDPDFRAAMGEVDYKENKEKDKIVCETIDKHISPAIYRLVCKHFNDPVYRESGKPSFQDADKWVDCWVGCASVMVQNGKKDWNFYFQYGPQSWEHVTDPDGKRRVGLRFMHKLLELDPPAYQAHTERFIEVLFQAMATPNVTLEHHYASLLFSIDRLYHPLLNQLPIKAPSSEDGDFHLKKEEFIEQRSTILDTMVKNLSDSLEDQARGNHSLGARNNTYITSVMALVGTMKDICEGLNPGTISRANYVIFCKQISELLTRYPTVSNHHRLATVMTWLRNIS